MSAHETSWYDANQRHLMAAVSEVRGALERFLGQEESREDVYRLAPMTPPPALDVLCSVFGLSSFERSILLMCAAVELDSRWSALLAAANKGTRRPQPTFSLALAAFDDAHWSAIAPDGPLRHWHLVEVLNGESLTTSPLRIQERILHYLAGVPCMDERLAVFLRPAPAPQPLVPSHRAIAGTVAAAWLRAQGERLLPVMELCGDEVSSKAAIAIAACSQVGLRLHVLSARNLPLGATDLDRFARLWELESAVSSSALLIDCEGAYGNETLSDGAAPPLLEWIRGPVLVAGRRPLRYTHRPFIVLEVNRPTADEQTAVWQTALDANFPALNGEVTTLVSQFSLSTAAIHSVAAQAQGADPCSKPEGSLACRLWEACRAQARPRLEGLAQRIEAAATWDDLVLPAKQKDILSQIAIHVRRRATVYQTWGFASKGARGLGISALFAGPSGTGKTMAGEVLASELRLDLYRIDLSQVVSKYIGETEKNLGRVFDAAEEGAVILLFDEADALFGKRSDVKDSHDRYANIEVSYLLQRMEAYRGLAILTTNRKSALDQAFLRRIRFVVEFPFPDVPERAEIWRRVFPQQTPTQDLRIDRLARLNATGGHIRNIALGAAFLAADGEEPVRMSHLLSAARSEFSKIERPLAEAEVAGWV